MMYPIIYQIRKWMLNKFQISKLLKIQLMKIFNNLKTVRTLNKSLKYTYKTQAKYNRTRSKVKKR